MRGEAPDGFVLAGGMSRRMGADKARMGWEGRPMALWVAEALGQVCGRVMLVRRVAEEADFWPIPVIVDPAHPGAHPLFGVAAALRAARTDRVVLAPCDLPRLDGASVRMLLDEPGPVVASDGRDRHPLVAVLPAGWAQAAWEAARQGASVRAFTAGCAEVVLPADRLFNRNRPGDRPSGSMDRA